MIGLHATAGCAFGGVMVEWRTSDNQRNRPWVHSRNHIFAPYLWLVVEKGNGASAIPFLSVILVVMTLSLGKLNQESWDLCTTTEQWHGMEG